MENICIYTHNSYDCWILKAGVSFGSFPSAVCSAFRVAISRYHHAIVEVPCNHLQSSVCALDHSEPTLEINMYMYIHHLNIYLQHRFLNQSKKHSRSVGADASELWASLGIKARILASVFRICDSISLTFSISLWEIQMKI